MEKLELGLKTAYIDGTVVSDMAYRPRFLTNNYREGEKVITSIEDELLRCDSFQMSVAFITMSGITPLLQTLKELEKRNIPGEILTTDYLCFSEPKALKKLHELSNLTVRMYCTDLAEEGFHTKGYIFKRDEIYRIIIGSSNMTSAALTSNKEWNTKLISTEQGEVAREILQEFQRLWSSDATLEFEEFYDKYYQKYEITQHQKKIAAQDSIISIEKARLEPNSMQLEFIDNLRELLDKKENRALLISATGTGKTYASAFAMRELGFKRVLFVVHRSELARQSMRAYKNVFDSTISMGLVGGGVFEYDKDYVFATVQTLGKEFHLEQYAPDAFDCIILDEAHHSVAGTYQKLMAYFQPRLWLGMTATPDRREESDGNVYEIFDHNIACEIRLQQAMEENLLCPFHYFGISELFVEDELNHHRRELSQQDFARLTSEERVEHILETAEYYGYSGERVKGLIFCSRIEEAKELSKKLNQHINSANGKYYRTLALDGSAFPEKRQEAFNRLAQDEGDGAIDYILSVEVLNEGVDIVEVNQVIMLRPTQSPIVFIQQLGRGLRKAYGKEYVVVLDFIGNYTNNFMIPIALSGDRTYNKDNIRRYVLEGERVIPGASTIHFDEVSRKRIFASVDKANFSDIKLIRQNYTNLKNKLGHVPSLMDFDIYGEMDVLRIFDNSSLGSYHKFLKKYEPEYKVSLSEDEEKVIEFVSKKLASGKRIQELLLLDRMLSYAHGFGQGGLFASLEKIYGKKITQNQKDNLVNVMTNEFPSGSGKKTYENCVFLEEDHGDYRMSKSFLQMLSHKEFYDVLQELVAFGTHRNHRDYADTYDNTDLVLYQKYTYEDVCRLLNWENNEVPLNIGGYKFDKKTKTFPVFINYDKGADISDSIKYEDHFTSKQSLIAISKSGRSIESDDVQNFLHAEERGIQVDLFVRKNKDDKISKEFYYLGHMKSTGQAREFIMPNTDKPAVEIAWELDVPVREDIYEYILEA